MYHRYSLGSIIGWAVYWVWQWIRYLLPDIIIRPDRVGSNPPYWWYSFASWSDWAYCVGYDGIPRACWYDHYREALIAALGAWVSEVGDWASSAATNAVKGWLGYIWYGYSSFSSWLLALWRRVGEVLPGWAYNVADALNRLYLWIPSQIRYGLQSWSSLFDSITNGVKDWVRSIYDYARGRALAAWDWIIASGQTLTWWYNSAHSWLDDFRYNASVRVRGWLGSAWDWLVGFSQNPAGVILAQLGVAWIRLRLFAENAVTFYFNLWSEYASEIGEFWGDPLGWLYDRAEDYLVSKW